MSDQQFRHFDEYEEELPKKKKRRFRLFDSQREGPGVEKGKNP